MSNWEYGFNITKRKWHLTARQDKLHQIEVERARKLRMVWEFWDLMMVSKFTKCPHSSSQDLPLSQSLPLHTTDPMIFIKLLGLLTDP